MSQNNVQAAFYAVNEVIVSDRTRIKNVIKGINFSILKQKGSNWTFTFATTPVTYVVDQKFLTDSQAAFLSHVLRKKSRTKK